jgi:hypothetical protein
LETAFPVAGGYLDDWKQPFRSPEDIPTIENSLSGDRKSR